MTFFRRLGTLVFVFVLCVYSAGAQDSSIGYWESHLPYNSGVGVATNGNIVYVAGSQGFFTHDPSNAGKVPVSYSKVEGMSDIGMQCIGYDQATGTAILIYTNGNIDLFKNNTFINIADLKITNISGTKQVYQVYTENGFAYLSTSLGVIVVDMANQKITQTYKFDTSSAVVPVYTFVSDATYFYASTNQGLYRIDKYNPKIVDVYAWQQIDPSTNIVYSADVDNTVFFSTTQSVSRLTNGSLTQVYQATTGNLTHIDAGYRNLYISDYNDTTFLGRVRTMDLNNNMTDSMRWPGKPMQVVQRMDSTVWIADFFAGLEKETDSTPARYVPVGPGDPSSFNMYVNNKNLWIAHGGYDDADRAVTDNNNISNLNNGKWKGYTSGNVPAFDSMNDFVCVLKDETTGILYAGSYLGGLFILKPDGSYSVVKRDVFDSSASYFDQHDRQIVSLGLDNSDNLWVTTFGSQHLLYARSATDSTWHSFATPNSSNGGPIAIDDNNQVWFGCYLNSNHGGGVTVYNAGGTLNDPSDDFTYHLTTGVGSGNLPSNNIFSIAKDKNNNIWVGTDNGIAIISNCNAPFTNSPPCDAEIPIVQYDQYAGYLFAGSVVRTIAVDGGNRKWIGTDEGVWLLSPDAAKIVYRFTVDNSPLPSNNIQSIAVDNVTGDVYIGTQMGLVTFHGTATNGGTSNQNVLVFPNPVKSGYTGTIAIKGLVANADVRITDINGQLVYRTTANGGMAVWNGVDYQGHRPQSGVYLVFASSSDGSQTYSGKIVFMQ